MIDMPSIMNDIRTLRDSRPGYDPESQLDFNWPEPVHVVEIPDFLKPKPRVLARDGNVVTVRFVD